MSDSVLVVLIVVAGLTLAIFLLRGRLRRFKVKSKGFGTDIEADSPGAGPETRANTVIRGNVQTGVGHNIDVSRDALVEENLQAGVDQTIVARPDSKVEAKRR